MSLENKAAIVTGSDSGIGRAIALELARQGAAVTINYHKNEDAADAAKKEIEAAGGKAQVIQADVSSVADIQRLVDSSQIPISPPTSGPSESCSSTTVEGCWLRVEGMTT